jgi:hypothetical protein
LLLQAADAACRRESAWHGMAWHYPGRHNCKGCTWAKSAFWLRLHTFFVVHRHLPCKGWDVCLAFFSLCLWPALTIACLVALLLLCALKHAFLFCSFSFWVADTCALCLLVEAPMLACVLLVCFAPAHWASSALWDSLCFFRWSQMFCSCWCMLLCCFHIVFLCFPSPCCASDVLLECPVSVVSVLIHSFDFVFCPVAVCSMILCSCRPFEAVFVTCDELSRCY